MAEILRFILVDEADIEADFEYSDREEAIKQAAKNGDAVLMRTYVYDDSELIWTPNGDDVWPPVSDGDDDDDND